MTIPSPLPWLWCPPDSRNGEQKSWKQRVTHWIKAPSLQIRDQDTTEVGGKEVRSCGV